METISGALPISSQRRDQIDKLKSRAKEIEGKLQDLRKRSVTPVRNTSRSNLAIEKTYSSNTRREDNPSTQLIKAIKCEPPKTPQVQDQKRELQFYS